VLQRVRRARVLVADETVGEIGPGLLVLLGVKQDDGPTAAHYMAEKIAQMRLFPDEEGRMNRSVLEAGGGVLVVSQFTLYGDARKGRRPSYSDAARPEVAEPLYERVCSLLHETGIEVASGRFGAMMEVEMLGDGPVTLLLDSERTF
jgi:D-tyrosyl-tRNA(Tyr) deacylase